MEIPISEIDNHVDDHVDREIELCFDKASPTSFFTFAGAGSGKTRSLINTLIYLDKEMGADWIRSVYRVPYVNEGQVFYAQ
ncbi:MAG: hypothetical protein P4L49_05650 [Desulfosporosinus sp.]|nr:hypothetical protein [Desulfosporosinus sp.]